MIIFPLMLALLSPLCLWVFWSGSRLVKSLLATSFGSAFVLALLELLPVPFEIPADALVGAGVSTFFIGVAALVLRHLGRED